MNKKLIGGLCACAFAGGLIIGLAKSKINYHQGKLDAANEFKEVLLKIQDEFGNEEFYMAEEES